MELEKLQKIIAEVLNVDTEEVTWDTTFVDDLGADSLDIFQIVMGIEEEFDIEIGPEYLVPENFNSAEAMWKMIQKIQEDED